MFAAMVFGNGLLTIIHSRCSDIPQAALFRGSDNEDQLLKVMKVRSVVTQFIPLLPSTQVLSTAKFDAYLMVYHIPFESDVEDLLGKCVTSPSFMLCFHTLTRTQLPAAPVDALHHGGEPAPRLARRARVRRPLAALRPPRPAHGQGRHGAGVLWYRARREHEARRTQRFRLYVDVIAARRWCDCAFAPSDARS
jgi:hypothetical protein